MKSSPKSARLDAAALTAVEDQFIELCNNMASLWGINPTMARIHGLLYVSGAALSMDGLMERLGISRGNVSMNLRELLDWGLIHRVHRRGDRKEYYESLSDVWEVFTLVAAQRKRRELDPILSTLRRCQQQLAPDTARQAGHSDEVDKRRHRINDLLKFLTLIDSLAERFFQSHHDLREAMELMTPAEDE